MMLTGLEYLHANWILHRVLINKKSIKNFIIIKIVFCKGFETKQFIDKRKRNP